jgi:hypothetical protein
MVWLLQAICRVPPLPDCVVPFSGGVVLAAGHEQTVLGPRVEWLPDMDSNHD